MISARCVLADMEWLNRFEMVTHEASGEKNLMCRILVNVVMDR
jgi:hypothetical protein